jgi:hypothetical protein
MTKPKDSHNKTLPEDDHLETTVNALQEMTEQLQPLIDFHQAMESSTDDDLRMFWDVKIVQGEDTPFASVQGSSSMPKALAKKMVPLAPSNIQKEVHQKIIEPLMSAMLDKFEVPPEVESPSPQ